MNYLDFIEYNELQKQRCNNKIHIDKVNKDGVVISSVSGTIFLSKKDFLTFLNTSNGYISNPSVLREFDFNLRRSIILYHGSINGLKGKIDIKYSNNLCDFGSGFYLGDNIMQASNCICNTQNSVLYTFELFEYDQKIYEFDDELLWTLYIAHNRQKYNFKDVKSLIKKFNFINSYDIIVGLIADDKISEVYEDFLNDYINSKVLSESLKLVKYGRQYVVKNQKYVTSKYLKIIDKKTLTVEDRKIASNWGITTKDNMSNNLNNIKIKFRRDNNGLYFSEILELIDWGKLYD